MVRTRRLSDRVFPFFILIIMFLLGLKQIFNLFPLKDGMKEKNSLVLTKNKLSQILNSAVSKGSFPTKIELQTKKKENLQANIIYSFDLNLQNKMQRLFHEYQPDYGAFVAIDATSGRLLSLISFSRALMPDAMREHFALKASFPSASIFKVVTAAAAIENYSVSADTLIPITGRSHTLYRKQVLDSYANSHAGGSHRLISLKDAFAFSVNVAFGKMGAFTVGSDSMRLYANRFGFDRKIGADLPMQEGRAFIPQDFLGLAESACGFTNHNKMSPLQGALIAASVVNNGAMMEPYAVESVLNADGSALYLAEPKLSQVSMDPRTAKVIRTLMRATVLRGTSRRSFRGFFKKNFHGFDVGGKTGSLTGYEPHGKYDWFVGYVDSGSQKIAFSSLMIHKKHWRVKSAYLARRAIEIYFKNQLFPNKTIVQK